MSRRSTGIHPLIAQVTQDVGTIAQYIENGFYAGALQRMSIVLGKLSPREKKRHKAFIDKIMGYVDFLRSAGGFTAADTGRRQNIVASQIWDQQLYNDFVSVLWDAGMITQVGGPWIDPSLGRPSPGKKVS